MDRAWKCCRKNSIFSPRSPSYGVFSPVVHSSDPMLNAKSHASDCCHLGSRYVFSFEYRSSQLLQFGFFWFRPIMMHTYCGLKILHSTRSARVFMLNEVLTVSCVSCWSAVSKFLWAASLLMHIYIYIYIYNHIHVYHLYLYICAHMGSR